MLGVDLGKHKDSFKDLQQSCGERKKLLDIAGLKQTHYPYGCENWLT